MAIEIKNLDALKKSGIKLSPEDQSKFEQFFNNSDTVSTSFPALKAFSGDGRQNEERATATADNAENNLGRNSSQNSIVSEQLLDSLDNIEQRLKSQGVVLQSSLEQATQTNQLLNRIAGSAGGVGGNGGSIGGGVGDGIIGGIIGAVGGAVVNFIKSGGKALLGGAVDAAIANPEISVPLAAAAALGLAARPGVKSALDSDNPAFGAAGGDSPYIEGVTVDDPNTKKVAENNTQIAAYQDLLGKLENVLKMNLETEAEKTKYLAESAELQKKITELQKENVVALAGNSGPHGVVGPASSLTPTDVRSATPDTMPPIVTDYATHTAIPPGQTALDVVRGMGTPAGGQGGIPRSGAARARASGGAASGGRAGNQAEAWNFFKSKGYSDEETAAIMGNLQQELQFNPMADNPKDVHNSDGTFSPSQGIAQWNDGRDGKTQRLTNMRNFVSQQFGKPYDQLSASEKYAGQLGFIDHEISTNYNKSRDALKSGDYRKFGHRYEGYGSPEYSGGEGTREENANRFLAAGRAGAFNQSNNSDGVLDNLKKARDLGLITNEQCVSLATAAVGIKLGDGQKGSNVHDWRRGENALSGDLKAGTPIATFLDRQGKTTDRYAGGGSGTPGAHLDHAAVFKGYTRDKDGHITGIDVEEQYKGSGGMQSHHYGIGGYGEADANNYFAVKTDQGYLGGKNNPMTPRPQSYRPEDSPQVHDPDLPAAQRLAEANYEHRSHAPAIRDIGIQAHANDIIRNHAALKDTGPSMSSILVKKDHETNIAALQSKSAPPVVQQFNSTTNHGNSGNEKSSRLSSKEVGPVNPPTSRIRELFHSDKNWYDT